MIISRICEVRRRYPWCLFFLETVKKATWRFRFYTIFAFCSSVKTDMGASGAISRLYIANANKKDSGNYSCALADVAAATTVSVHVLNGTFVYRRLAVRLYPDQVCICPYCMSLYVFFFFFFFSFFFLELVERVCLGVMCKFARYVFA